MFYVVHVAYKFEFGLIFKRKTTSLLRQLISKNRLCNKYALFKGGFRPVLHIILLFLLKLVCISLKKWELLICLKYTIDTNLYIHCAHFGHTYVAIFTVFYVGYSPCVIGDI